MDRFDPPSANDDRRDYAAELRAEQREAAEAAEKAAEEFGQVLEVAVVDPDYHGLTSDDVTEAKAMAAWLAARAAEFREKFGPRPPLRKAA